MTNKVPDLVPGRVELDYFETLLADTQTSGVGVIAALREHLVHGATKPDAARKFDVALPQFYKRLRGIEARHDFAWRVSRFYVTQPLSRVQRHVDQLIGESMAMTEHALAIQQLFSGIPRDDEDQPS